MSSSYCELPAFYSHSEPTARKRHVCCECAAPILLGEKHFRGAGKWEGEFQEHRQHLVCMEACMLIRDDFYGGDCVGFGCLKEEFSEIECDSWYPERDRYKPSWAKLRHLMAVILWRERKAKQEKR